MEVGMNASDFDNSKVNKASRWTIYFLVDLKAVFIITYVYISVVNLISSTADSEATRDAQSMIKFNVTSHPDHETVEVDIIDNAILWKCRDKSVTKHYYRGLYWMLIAAILLILIVFTIVKLCIVVAASHGSTYLWRLAVLEHLHETLNTGKYHDEDALWYDRLLSQKGLKINISKGAYQLRKILLTVSVITLPIAILLSALSYDLHPLSCIFGISEDTISYNETSKTVEIRYSDGILLFQKISAFFVVLLALNFLIIILGFAYLNYTVIKRLKGQVNEIKITVIKQEIKKVEKDIKKGREADIKQLQSRILKYKKILLKELRKSCEYLQELISTKILIDEKVVERLSKIISSRKNEIDDMKRNGISEEDESALKTFHQKPVKKKCRMN